MLQTQTHSGTVPFEAVDPKPGLIHRSSSISILRVQG
jgi:hypothetical protein